MNTTIEAPSETAALLEQDSLFGYAGTLVHVESTKIPLRDFRGHPLPAGCAIELGFFSRAGMADPFRGKWTPLAGPSAVGPNREIPLFRLGDDALFVGEHTFISQIENLPRVGVPLALRFYDAADPSSARFFNTASNPSWWFRGAKAPRPSLVFASLDFDGVSWESGERGGFHTALTVFGSLFSRLMNFEPGEAVAAAAAASLVDHVSTAA